MINLLPKQQKQELVAARTNSLLIRYNVVLVGALLFLLLVIGIAYLYLNNTKLAAENTIRDNQAKVSDFSSTEEQAKDFRQNLVVAKQILDREVNYTKVMLKIANLLPPGIVLSSLNLDSSTFGTPTTLTAQAKSYDQALALKDAFSQSLLFSDVHFQSITASESATSYPLTVSLSVTFKKEAAK